MATKVAIAMMRDAALGRLEGTMNMLSQQFDLDVPTLPKQGHDFDLLSAQRLDVLATFLDSLAAVLKPASLESMTVAELRTLAEERGVDLDGVSRKADIISALENAEKETAS